MHASQICSGCSNAIVSLSIRCSKCKLNESSNAVESVPAVESKRVVSDDSPSDSSDSELGQDVYEVEEVLQRRKLGRLVEYLVAWKGYPADVNSWEPASGLTGARDAIVRFNSSQSKSHAIAKLNSLEAKSLTEISLKPLPLPVSRVTRVPQLQ